MTGLYLSCDPIGLDGMFQKDGLIDARGKAITLLDRNALARL
ncbi:protein of unknown function [Pararobbsia alpina]